MPSVAGTSRPSTWATPSLRKEIVEKINLALVHTTITKPCQAENVEEYVYMKSFNRDQYLGLAARMILQILTSRRRGFNCDIGSLAIDEEKLSTSSDEEEDSEEDY